MTKEFDKAMKKISEPTNTERANRGRITVERYKEGMGEAFEGDSSEIVDLITDLLHYLHEVDLGDDPVESTLRLAQSHYEAEKVEEEA